MSLGKWLQKPELVFLTLATIFGILSAVMMPMLQVPDESRHFEMEYAVFSPHSISDGTVLSRDVIVNTNGPLTALRQHDYRDYYTTRVPARYGGFTITTHGDVAGTNIKVSVFDLLHLPQSIGVLVGRFIYSSIGVEALFGRLFNLTLYIVGLYFIIKNIRYGKWVLAFIACLPMMIQQAASLSYDGINLLAVFAWFAFMINVIALKARPSRKHLVLGLLAALFLVLTKANNVLLLLLVFALPARYITDTNACRKLRANSHWRAIKSVAFSGLVLVFLAGFYVVAKHLLAGHQFHPHKLFDVLMNTFVWGDRSDLTLIDTSVTGMIGEFGIFYYHLPIWAVVSAFTTLTVLLLHDELPSVSKRLAVISGALFFGSVLIISIGMYYSWAMLPWRLGPGAEVADGIQGRYFTPLLILLFPTFAYLQRYLKVTTTRIVTMPLIVTGTSTFLLLFYALDTWHFFWK